MNSAKNGFVESLVKRYVAISLESLMQRFSVKPGGVLHVGGNLGSEADLYRRCGFSRVVWVEGWDDFFKQLVKNIEPFPEQQAYKVLVSDVEDQEVKFRIASNTGSSTMFQPGEAFEQNFAGIEFVKTETLRTQRLDKFFERERVDLSGLNVLVLDIEGAELKALMSLGEYLSGFDAILTEISIAPNFVDGPLLWDLDRFLLSRGFCRKAMQICRSSGDAFYARSSGAAAAFWTRHSGRLYGLLYRMGYYRVKRPFVRALQKLYHRLSGR